MPAHIAGMAAVLYTGKVRVCTFPSIDCGLLLILTNNYRCLKKVFVSIKGIYFQCNIQVYMIFFYILFFLPFKWYSCIFLNDTAMTILQGQPVTWIGPHAFSQHYPKDVDFSVMLTFLDFYLVSLYIRLLTTQSCDCC